MAMSQKYYREASDTIREVVNDSKGRLTEDGRMEACRSIARGLAWMFAQDNPRFDRDKFLDACGL